MAKNARPQHVGAASERAASAKARRAHDLIPENASAAEREGLTKLFDLRDEIYADNEKQLKVDDANRQQFADAQNEMRRNAERARRGESEE